MKLAFITKSRKAIMMMIASLLICGAVTAQRTVTGKVIERKTNNAIAGVSVLEKGTKNGVTSDDDGNFSITLKGASPVLEISFVGFKPQTVNLNSRSRIDVFMDEEASGLSDVVVIGYQSVQRKMTSAAISTVKGKDFENVPYPTFDQMLQGRVAGLNILSVTGEPGINNIVTIRGSTSIDNAGNGLSTPLYVIDGIVLDVSDARTAYGNVNPLQAINPNDIESVDVLKDASAAAIYGARAANGVIIIRTKRPKTGRPQFRISSYVGVSTKPAMKKVMVGAAERQYKMDLLKNGGAYAQLGALSQFLTDSLNPAFNNNTDWQGMFLKNGIIKNFDVNIAGATETFAYRISLNRYDEEGILRGYKLTRTTPRLYLSIKPYKGIEVSTDLFLGFTKALHGPGNAPPGSFNLYPFTVSNFPSSFWNITDEVRANYEGRNTSVRDDDRTTSINGNTRFIATINPNFTFTSSLSYNFGFARRDYLRHKSVTTNNRSDAIHYSSNSRRWEIENYLTYTKGVNGHTFTGLLGQGAEQNTIYETRAQANGIPFDAIQMVQGVAAGPNLSASTSFEDRSRVSLFARVGYDYKERYGIDASFRRDASSRYSASSRWGTFPAASVRWNVSEESFFEPMKNVVSFLKLRASYGITGRDPGGYYAQYRILSSNVPYAGSSLGQGAAGNVISYSGTTAVVPNYGSSAPAANITWERTPQVNFGLDASLFRERISFNMDYYIKDSRELIFDIPVATTTGYTTAQNNYVDVRNKGFEFTMTTQNLSPRSKLKWSTTLNVAFNDNFVTKLPAGGRDFLFGPAWLQRSLTIGQPLFGFRAWQIPGVYSTVDDVPVDPLTGLRVRWQGGNMFGAGDGNKMDMNGDYNIQDIDKIYMGDPQTRIYGGFINNLSFKGFNVQILCTFINGRKLWNGYLSDKLNGSSNNPYSTWGPGSGPAADFGGLEFWRQPGDQAYFPSLFGNAIDKWHIGQSLFIEDASFFRVKNINLSYAIPGNVAQRVKLRGIRIYSVIDNIAVFHNATVPDPELVSPDGYTNGNDFPLPKKFTFGLELQF